MNKPLLFINSATCINESIKVKYDSKLKLNKKYIVILKNGTTLSGILKRINYDNIVILCNDIIYTIQFININNILLLNKNMI